MAQGKVTGGLTISQLPHTKVGESRRAHAVKGGEDNRPHSAWTCACGCDVKVIASDMFATTVFQSYGFIKLYAYDHAPPGHGRYFCRRYDADVHAFQAEDSTKTGAPAAVHVGVDYAKTDHDRDVGQKSFDFFEFDPEMSPTGRRAPDALKFPLQNLPPRSSFCRDLYGSLPDYGMVWPEPDVAPFAKHAESLDALRRRISDRFLYGPHAGRRTPPVDLSDDVAGAIRQMRESLPLGTALADCRMQFSEDGTTWVDAETRDVSDWFGGHRVPVAYRYARLVVTPPTYPERVDLDLQIDEKGNLKTVVSDRHYGEGSAAIAAALGFGK